MELMLSCRDCKYGFVGLESGIVSCMKANGLTYPEAANYCAWYDSVSKKEWSWKELKEESSK